MSTQISSSLSRVFQIAFIVKFITLSIVFFITLFIFDWKTNLVIIAFWIIWFFILRRMGITKLRTVYWDEQTLSIENLSSKYSIKLTDIVEVKRTFLFSDFPYRIKYKDSGNIKTVHFLPKSKLFQGFLSENDMIEKLRREVK